MPEQYDKELFFKALQTQFPKLKSQGQFNAFQAAFEAFRAVLNSIYEGGNPVAEKEAMEALMQAFAVSKTATELTRKLEDVPEAAEGRAADEFKQAPAEFGEYDDQRKLFTELAHIENLKDLMDWWKTNRARIDRVKSPSLRNPLLDAIRERKIAFEAPKFSPRTM
jgi:hypothetical protein